MDKQSGESKEENVMGERIGESEMEELVSEWGWQRDRGSWLQRQLVKHRPNERRDQLFLEMTVTEQE